MSDAIIILIIVMAVLLTFGGIAVVVILALRRQSKVLDALGDGPLAEAMRRPGRMAVGEWAGLKYSCRYTPGGRSSPSSLSVWLDCPSSGAFAVRKESAFDRVGKGMGLTREVQTGDGEFDDLFFIESNREAFAVSFFGEAVRRQAVRFLFRLGAARLRHNGKTMEAVWSPFAVRADTNPSFVNDAVSLLGILTKDLPAVPPPVPGAGGSRAGIFWTFAVAVLSELVGVLALVIGLVRYEPLDPGRLMLRSLAYSLPLLAAFCVAAAWLLRGRSTSHVHYLIALLLALIGFPLAGAGVEMWLNGALDAAPPMQHAALAVEKYVSKSDDSLSYYVIVKSWRPGRETEKLGVDWPFYTKVEEGGSTLAVTTKPGRFGFEWLVSLELLEL